MLSLHLTIDILKHISTVVLQDFQRQIQTKAEGCEDKDIEHEKCLTQKLVPHIKIQTKAEDCEDKDIEHEKCLTQELVPRIKILKEVKEAITADCMLLYVFMYYIYCNPLFLLC